MSNLKNLNVTQLYGLLASHMGDTAISIKKACEVIAELARRNERPDCAKSGVFRYFREINSGKLTPEAVMRFASTPDVLAKLSGGCADMQNKIAAGGVIPVVVAIEDGKPVVAEKNVLFMSRAERDRALSGGAKTIPVDEQAKTVAVAAHERKKAEERKRLIPVQAVKAKNALRIGDHEIPAARVIAALESLGYSVTK